MKTTDKNTCRFLIDLLVEHGVTDAVISPGSRNTPLIIAANRHEGLSTHVVIDERCAAFIGLGIALQTGRPVALICTSGTAVLNYAPALAEAYYRQIPLIAISADRPAEWIDQDDSQTIRQNGVLNNIVKGSFDIYGENSDKVHSIFATRAINDALALAKKGPKGPVHINVRLDEPLSTLAEIPSSHALKIEHIHNANSGLNEQQYAELSQILTNKKIMVIAGFGSGNPKLIDALDVFSKKTGAVVFHEAQSNIHLDNSVAHIDTTISILTNNEKTDLQPDVVISFGGAILSRFVKQYLRQSSTKIEHWHISESTHAIDCYLALSKRIECDVTAFFNGLSKTCDVKNIHSDYIDRWKEKSNIAEFRTNKFFNECNWSDFYAIGRIMALAPKEWHLHFSNGTAIRYAQLFDYSKFSQIECNRGVSGIDGCTSTAIGAHIHYKGTTLLVSGDMSAQYDMGALATTEISPRFKMAVLNNGGGGIFRFIKSTSRLDECEHFFAADVRLPLKELANAFGFAYFEVSDKNEFDEEFPQFVAEASKPAIINIITPPQESADTIKRFFNSNKNN